MSTYNDSVGEVDIIFAGGGAAACVTAGRLAKANPDLRILLVEGGGNNFNDPAIVNPAVFLSHLAPESKATIFYKSQPSKYLGGREAIVPAGGIFGGGSSINFMMYTRAQAIDFDNWDTDGWAAKDMLPLCKKLETYHPIGPNIDQSKHGHDGPIHISDGGYRGKSENQFIKTVKKMGYSTVTDLQDLEANNSFSKWHRFVSPDGKRQDSAHQYIHPLLQDGQHPNLHILVNSKVIRILFDSSLPSRAIGIEYSPNADKQPSLSLSKPVYKTIQARKLVVIAAGALGTPQILERSGLGNPKYLKPLGIPVISDLPGVGENYQDHQLVLYPYKTSLNKRETLDGILSGRQDLAKLIEQKDPILGWNGIDVCAKLRPSAPEIAALGPSFMKDWETHFAPYPSKPAMLLGVVSAFLADQSLVSPGQYMTLGTYTAYPFSRGSIHITSPTDTIAGYKFDTGFLSHKSDLKKQLWAYKMSREIARRLPYFKGELELGHPKFAVGSRAALFDGSNLHNCDKSGEIVDLVYNEEDDRAIEDWIRGNINTTWHSLGTCAMRDRDKGGVVNKDLNVYGTIALKIADLSIVPENVGANTNNTALLVGEKAAIIIARELGIELDDGSNIANNKRSAQSEMRISQIVEHLTNLSTEGGLSQS